MNTVVLPAAVVQPVPSPAKRDHANLALRIVLDAEIEALKARHLQRSAGTQPDRGLTRADLDRQFGWLLDSVAKLQVRRDALC